MKRESLFIPAVLSILLILILHMPSSTLADDKKAYQEAKESFENLYSYYSSVKGAIDEAYDVMYRFNSGVRTWRNAVSRETQNRGIEEIDKLADDKIEAVIDALFDKAKEAIGIPEGIEIDIPDSIKEKVTEKLRNKFKGYIPPKIKNKLGYMYTLSALDRRLRDGYIYENLEYLKVSFDRGARLLGNFNNAVKFIDTFSPGSTEDNPVGRLKKVKDFLGMLENLAKPVPLMGTVINNYAKATDSFVTALNNLNEKLKAARQGSLCGQIGVDREIQDFFERTYPREDCLTYLSVHTSEYPLLSPIRAWEGNRFIFVWFDGNGTMVRGDDFKILYRSFSALKNSYEYSGLATHNNLYNLIKASHRTNISALSERAKNIHQKIGRYDFGELLKMEGLYRGDYIGQFVGQSGNAYRLYLDSAEFVGLYLFNSVFRNDVDALYDKYKDAFVINGTVNPSVQNVSLAGVAVYVDNQPTKELRCDQTCSFRHVVMKPQYNVRVVAEGFRDANKNFSGDRYPYITLDLSSIRIEADKRNVAVGEKVSLTAVIDGRVTHTGKYYWSINGKPYGGNTNRIELVPPQAGLYKINVTLADEKGRVRLEANHSVNVVDRLIYLYIQGPSEVQRDVETTFSAQVKGGMFSQSQARYAYSWLVNGRQYGGNDSSIKVRFDKEGSQSIKAVMWQWIAEQKRWQKVSEASHYLIVKPPQPLTLNVTITGPSSGYIGQDFTFFANIEQSQRLRELVKDPNPKTGFRWMVNNRPYGGYEGSQKVRFDTTGKHTITVVAWVWNPTNKSWLQVGEASHHFEAFGRLYTERRYSLRPQPTPTPKPTPSPSPKAREFGELTAEEQQKVLNCLCRCNSTAASHLSVYYDPKPDNHSPSCSDPNNGPCINKGFGCWRHYPETTGECAERCYKSNNVKSVPNTYIKGGPCFLGC